MDTASLWVRQRGILIELDGIQYDISAQRLQLEEVIKIVASVIVGPAGENVIVGGPQ